ncbi:LytR/AlgR family response regulator transcription factor [Arenibacter algicola]|jgi:DNA-binding LytR/AlgR family response regulator|uniref:Transcriptional regulatory protein YehT n=1 Tax=Arenibacter algicola TaxID=616991 RepID=A0A221V1C2_9FLAO|nr:LytTR family DNA-binding domain-containing protein [Arenibacter algicola]ASO07394.1 transcriptional regulatory protein YehT [Arenibacter algicola]HCO83113.1 DNA-binding response regulator [Arenibacter sp.]|tara:strand:- start:106 stop:798 length:693 start_codon:yes stop_codon:yes gene_type:complete
MKLKSIIVDDSSMQRMAVAQLVNKHPNLALVAQYSNAIEANNGIKNNDIDLIFLDVEMPIINGFDLLESLENPPQVILITGKPDYALKAFDYDVTDYLYKPISSARFEASIKRAVVRHEQSQNVNVEEEYIFVKSNLKKRKVVLNDIKWVEALGDYIKVVTNEGNIVILSTMKSFEKQLPEDKFLRIHKSYIVNLEKVEKFNSKNIEVEGRQVPLSRNKKNELMEALSNF